MISFSHFDYFQNYGHFSCGDIEIWLIKMCTIEIVVKWQISEPLDFYSNLLEKYVRVCVTREFNSFKRMTENRQQGGPQNTQKVSKCHCSNKKNSFKWRIKETSFCCLLAYFSRSSDISSPQIHTKYLKDKIFAYILWTTLYLTQEGLEWSILHIYTNNFYQLFSSTFSITHSSDPNSFVKI